MLHQLNAKWLSMIMAFNVALILGGQNQAAVPGEALIERTSSLEQREAKDNSKTAAIKEVNISLVPKLGPDQAAGASSQSYKFTPVLQHDLQRYQAIEVVATGYYAGVESTGKHPGHPEYGITRSGIKVKRDESGLSTIAADPKIFPMGSVLYIPGYGYGIVADTGGAIKGKKIDLFYNTKEDIYKEWGKKKLNVYLVKKGDGKVNQKKWNELVQEIFLQKTSDTPKL